MGKVRCNCNNCGQFVWKYPCNIHNQTYCSFQCYQDDRNKKEEYVCNNCGDTFLEYPCNRKEGSSYCSSECYHDSRGERIEFECTNCNKSFIKLKSQIHNMDRPFCSKSCYFEDKGIYPNTCELREKIQERNRKRRMRKNLSDEYIKEIIFLRLGRDYSPSNEEIQAKRIQIMAHRQANDNLKITPELCQNVKLMSMIS